MRRRPTPLSIAYLGIAALWQAVLWNAMPNVGMGGMAIIYVVWPFLALSTLCLWFVLRAVAKGRTAIFVTALALMLLATVELHPQDSQLSFAQKLGAVSQYILAT